MSHEQFGRNCNVVLTTNFDDMVADALYLYTNKKPLVIMHDSLASFVRISRTRPLVLKLHGDAKMSPRNTVLETKDLDEAVQRVLKSMLMETGLIFIGYGANDQSIISILSDLPPGALPWGIYWVSDSIPNNEMKHWLEKRNATWVEHLDFDQLFHMLKIEFQLSDPDQDRFNKLMNSYLNTLNDLSEKGNVLPTSAKAVKRSDPWWEVVLEARKYMNDDTQKAKQIYQSGISLYPGSSKLAASFAIFLKDTIEDYDQAEEYYEKAIELQPDFAEAINHFAVFLEQIRKDYDRAEEYYLRTLELDDNDDCLRLSCNDTSPPPQSGQIGRFFAVTMTSRSPFWSLAVPCTMNSGISSFNVIDWVCIRYAPLDVVARHNKLRQKRLGCIFISSSPQDSFYSLFYLLLRHW